MWNSDQHKKKESSEDQEWMFNSTQMFSSYEIPYPKHTGHILKQCSVLHQGWDLQPNIKTS